MQIRNLLADLNPSLEGGKAGMQIVTEESLVVETGTMIEMTEILGMVVLIEGEEIGEVMEEGQIDEEMIVCLMFLM